MPLLGRRREEGRQVREELTRILRRLNDRLDGIFSIVYTREGLPVVVYPENVVDPLDASAQASAISGAVESFTQNIGVKRVNYIVVSGEDTNIVIVSNERYGLMAAVRERNVGLALSMAINALNKCTEVISE